MTLGRSQMRYTTPRYRPDMVHVVRYYKDGQARRIVGRSSFKELKRIIEELHGKDAAKTAVSWGWQIPPIDD